MTAPKAKGLVERAVGEAVSAVAAPNVRDRVVALALGWAQLPEIPERGPEVAEFIHGPLSRAVEHLLGAEAADSVRDELAVIVNCLAANEISEVRPSWPGDAPELEIEIEEPPPPRPRSGVRNTDPAPKNMPTILIASSDPASVSGLGLALGGFAVVEPVNDAVSMLESFGRAETSLIVVDCRHPTVRAETLLAMQPELPIGSRVVFWGEAPALERQLDSLGEGLPESFVFCGREAAADDVAAVCRILIE